MPPRRAGIFPAMAENVLAGWDGDGDGKIDITEWETRMNPEHPTDI